MLNSDLKAAKKESCSAFVSSPALLTGSKIAGTTMLKMAVCQVGLKCNVQPAALNVLLHIGCEFTLQEF